MSSTPIVKNLQPVAHANAQGKQKEILDLALKQVGFIPNMYAGMANAPAVLSNFSNHLFATPIDERFSAYQVA